MFFRPRWRRTLRARIHPGRPEPVSGSPAADGTQNHKGFERNSTFEDPATRWLDFDPKMPMWPSVVVVTKKGGGSIGGRFSRHWIS